MQEKRGPQLDDILAYNVCEKLNDKDKITKLFLSLKMNLHTIDTAFTNDKNDITAIARKLMTDWRNSMETKEKAYTTLWYALTSKYNNLCNIAHEVLGEHPTGKMNVQPVENEDYLLRGKC